MSERDKARRSRESAFKGKLPPAMEKYEAWDPGFQLAYLDFRKQIYAGGAHSYREMLMMAIATLVGQRARGALALYIKAALDEGATEAQIRDALRVGLLFAGGGGIETASVVMEVLAAESKGSDPST